MRSKLYTAAVLASLVPVAPACSPSSDYSQPDLEVGRAPETYSAAYMWRAGDANTVVAVDRKGRTVQQFSLEPFAHVRSLPLVLDYDDQGVVSSHDGAYHITTAGAEFAILKADGTAIKNPVELLGSIRSIAFDPVHHLAVLSDEFQSMALLVLQPDGEVVSSWKAGSLFGDDQYIVAGTMLADGRLVLTLGENSLAVVDVEASVAAQSWQYKSFEIADARTMTWVASVPDQDNVVMVLDNARTVTINIDTGAVISAVDLTSRNVLGKFRDYVPHLVSTSASDSTSELNTITYVGDAGALEEHQLRGTTSQSIRQSLLDRGANLFTIVYDAERRWSHDEGDYYAKQTIYRFRLSDNLALDKTEVEEDIQGVATPDWLFLLYPSALGKAARWTYGRNPDKTELKGYNFDLYRQRYTGD